jgi:glycosyltransferase involved in cell wall biosynthesis
MTMREFPLVTILITTYKRPLELEQTIDALHQFIVYPADKLTYLIVDDCSELENYPHFIRQIPRFSDLHIEIISTSRNSGIGASMNLGFENVRSPYVFYTQDDLMPTQPLDLRKSVALMEVQPNIGIIRYRALGSDQLYIYRQHEMDLSEWLPIQLAGDTALPGKCVYLILDKDSHSLYVYSDNPHLRRMTWFEQYGYHPVGLKLGAQEESYAHHVKDVMRRNPDALWIVTLPEWVNSHYAHIGHSWKETAIDVERV